MKVFFQESWPSNLIMIQTWPFFLHYKLKVDTRMLKMKFHQNLSCPESHLNVFTTVVLLFVQKDLILHWYFSNNNSVYQFYINGLKTKSSLFYKECGYFIFFNVKLLLLHMIKFKSFSENTLYTCTLKNRMYLK